MQEAGLSHVILHNSYSRKTSSLALLDLCLTACSFVGELARWEGLTGLACLPTNSGQLQVSPKRLTPLLIRE